MFGFLKTRKYLYSTVDMCPNVEKYDGVISVGHYYTCVLPPLYLLCVMNVILNCEPFRNGNLCQNISWNARKFGFIFYWLSGYICAVWMEDTAPPVVHIVTLHIHWQWNAPKSRSWPRVTIFSPISFHLVVTLHTNNWIFCLCAVELLRCAQLHQLDQHFLVQQPQQHGATVLLQKHHRVHWQAGPAGPAQPAGTALCSLFCPYNCDLILWGEQSYLNGLFSFL